MAPEPEATRWRAAAGAFQVAISAASPIQAAPHRADQSINRVKSLLYRVTEKTGCVKCFTLIYSPISYFECRRTTAGFARLAPVRPAGRKHRALEQSGAADGTGATNPMGRGRQLRSPHLPRVADNDLSAIFFRHRARRRGTSISCQEPGRGHGGPRSARFCAIKQFCVYFATEGQAGLPASILPLFIFFAYFLCKGNSQRIL
jgi:hypothetical protein